MWRSKSQVPPDRRRQLYRVRDKDFLRQRDPIGKHVLIANYVLLNGYDGHPLDPMLRAAGARPGSEGFRRIRIEDFAWLDSDQRRRERVPLGCG
jgi:hypothetical protein